MLASKNTYLKSAYQQLQVISQDKEKRLEYEARQKAILDHNQFLLEAEMRGRLEGEQIGRLEGEQIGRQAGKEAIARKLIALGYETDDIIQITDLSQEQIEALMETSNQ